ncbi:hypothetical protein BU23DRAFT_215019 [Bimuria novae-zelandiae CBS 107.79]|uniref:Secreted protein n=1 Tax=Bimuria novae-zelandiae CBS 107.79 TaxID=1447943 RepID=A0A6A5UY63_9PLEO|nr:hypothetical protein BU23DRAFT_215019 [Bimuria novae-zelandiae CBS 107.79]
MPAPVRVAAVTNFLSLGLGQSALLVCLSQAVRGQLPVNTTPRGNRRETPCVASDAGIELEGQNHVGGQCCCFSSSSGGADVPLSKPPTSPFPNKETHHNESSSTNDISGQCCFFSNRAVPLRSQTKKKKTPRPVGSSRPVCACCVCVCPPTLRDHGRVALLRTLDPHSYTVKRACVPKLLPLDTCVPET